MDIMGKPYQTLTEDLLSIHNIRDCESHVFSLQKKLDKAVADNDIKSIREKFNLLTKNSLAVKALAVHRITQRNRGKYTAGIDGVSIPKIDRGLQIKTRLELLSEIDILRKPDPIKRIFIPKANGKKRPLGIPTLRDRVNQEILRIGIEPIAEYHFSYNSWGFRPKRSCHDAIQQLFNKLSKRGSPRYILEGDIKGCFDNIDHEHIVKTLLDWKVPKWATELTLKMLKSGIFHNGELYDSETGTPQGGVISPLLANVALTSLDNFCLEQYGRKYKDHDSIREYNPIVRYADDFIIVCKSKQVAEQTKVEITKHLHNAIGLQLSEEKTNITHISKGFNFLGFNIRKFPKPHARLKPKTDREWSEYKLLITPQKEKVRDFLRGCSEVIDKNKTTKQSGIISLLNPKLVGWCMYYRHVVSSQIFSSIDETIWKRLYSWSKRRHPNKSNTWIIRKNFTKISKGRSTVFTDRTTGLLIHRLGPTHIKRFIMLNAKFRVYDRTPETQEYWKKREYTNAFKQIYSVKMSNLFKKQYGKCSYCYTNMSDEQIKDSELHAHHLLPRSFGGTESYSNLRLLHLECHRELHAKFSHEKMYTLVKEGFDYLKVLP